MLMEFLQPGSLAEALAAKAATPDAVPIAGGTDVMVELNFARRRPAALLDLTRVPELAGWRIDGGLLRVGAGVTYAELTGERARGGRPRRAGRPSGWVGWPRGWAGCPRGWAGCPRGWAGGCPGWRSRRGRSARRRSATAAPSAATWARRRRPGTATRACSRPAHRSRSPLSGAPG